MLCSISGVPPQEPVVSIKSGHVFEKRLIEKHLQVSNTCPVSSEELDIKDLLPVKGVNSIKPRAPDATSLPSLMSTMQNEWDAVMLETFTLKQHLEATRQELAHALYQHDAACRVIARLIKERDEAREALLKTQDNVATALKSEDAKGISSEVLKVMRSVGEGLSVGRKKRIKELAKEATKVADIKKFSVSASHSLHSASMPGVTSLDIHPDENMMLTGGADGNAIVFNRKAGKIVDTLSGHKKKITSVKFHPTEKVLFTTSADNTATVWKATSDDKYKAQHVLRTHKDSVTGCTLHPSGKYLVTASADKTWCFFDIETGSCRQQVEDNKITAGYTQVAFHPDGLILGAGTSDSLVRIFDATLQKNVANFGGHVGKVTALAFSENGYYLASGDEKGGVKLWDLRKLKNIKEIKPAKAEGGIGSLVFDSSGTYLAIGAGTVGVYETKSWECVKTWSDHKDTITSVKFGKNASFVATASKDRTVKFFQ